LGWHYKLPQSFPAYFSLALKTAVIHPDHPVVLGSYRSDVEASSVAERFRWYRWCIRKEPSAARELYMLLETYDFRTFMQTDEVGILLSLIAQPTKLSEFMRLNPQLAETLLRDCQ
jgi:hypothetical protein